MFKSRLATVISTKGVPASLTQLASIQIPDMAEIEELISCPSDSDINDFIAYNLCQFVEDIEAFVMFIKTECCEQECCKVMNAGPGNKYLWQQGTAQPVEISSTEYCAKLLAWITEQLNNRAMFPIDEGQAYPKDFIKQVKVLFRRLFRVYMHIYHCHLTLVKKNGLEQKLQYCIKIYVEFMKKHKLCEDTDFEPIKPLLQMM
ncbi:Mob1-like_protein [Hexamita inflata]|uniref:Mob1-like protein n=1 Tax=Hexamita inflata TaxID=28002 RepID=A0AA86UUS9_9EUKA|nr:Mob1-like protein [Hexamita inflata]CAI9968754.1 Mob1-like protein [Hexamita inflata]